MDLEGGVKKTGWYGRIFGGFAFNNTRYSEHQEWHAKFLQIYFL